MKLLNIVWNKEEMPHKWKESIIMPVYKKGEKTDCSNDGGLSLLSNTKNFIQNLFFKVNSKCRQNYWGLGV
jgi:hypothetical protein